MNDLNKGFESLSELRGLNNVPDSSVESSEQTSNNKKSKKSLTNAMEVVLERSVELQRFPVLARISIKRPRPDIVRILDEISTTTDSVPPRLRAFLEREKLCIDGAITDKGKAVQASGLFDTKERGLYHIWYTKNDPLLGTRPLLLQRDTAFFEPNANPWLEGSDAERSDFTLTDETQLDVFESPLNDNSAQLELNKLTITSIVPEVVCSQQASATAHIRWVIGHDKSSTIEMNGQLDMLKFSSNPKEKPAPRTEALELTISHGSDQVSAVMQSIAQSLKGQWREEYSRIALPIEDATEHGEVVQDFLLQKLPGSKINSTSGDFDVKRANIALMPADQYDAGQWHKSWLNSFYSSGYHSAAEAQKEQSKWLMNSALSDFRLPILKGQKLLERLNPQAKWRAAAIDDLTPSKSRKMRLPITLLSGDEQNTQQLMSKLTSDALVQQVIYSDRYMHTNKHQKNLQAIAACFPSATGLLLSLVDRKQERQLPAGWKEEAFEKEHDNHGRFWIFVTNSSLYCWECSIGVDYMDFQNSEGPNTFLVEGTPGFTPKEVEDLPKYLQDTIAKFNKTGAV